MKKTSSRAAEQSTKRSLGLYHGQIWMAPDFDAPMKFVEVKGDMLLVPDRSRAIKKKGKRQKPPGRARNVKKSQIAGES
jgi:hypothetical protein